jgi:hypothetical protein
MLLFLSSQLPLLSVDALSSRRPLSLFVCLAWYFLLNWLICYCQLNWIDCMFVGCNIFWLSVKKQAQNWSCHCW